jgi:hypothetical protein
MQREVVVFRLKRNDFDGQDGRPVKSVTVECFALDSSVDGVDEQGWGYWKSSVPLAYWDQLAAVPLPFTATVDCTVKRWNQQDTLKMLAIRPGHTVALAPPIEAGKPALRAAS